jgi:hypothetical protein
MVRCVTNITFTQAPNDAFPNRNKSFFFDFVNEFECKDSWTDLTNSGKITVPKNVYIKSGNKLVSLGDINKNIGGFSSTDPLFLRGDRVVIESGYKYRNKNGVEVKETNIIFKGFISQVGAKKPIEIEVEDNMWKLKQIAAPNKVYPKTATLESILSDLLAGSGFTVNALTETTLGDFRVQNETVAEVLAQIQKDYHFYSYFRGDELRSGALVYIENEANEESFEFQKNIIEDDLEYKRKDDIQLSAVAYSVNKLELNNGTTKDGHQKTKHERLSVFVSFKNGKFISQVKKKGEEFPVTDRGESRTLYYWDVTDPQKLIELAKADLEKFYYTGLRGKFTTFGLPFVRQGDNATLVDPVLPEKNGTYKIKSVEYKGGTGGHRQIIELDYKIK